MLWYTNYKKRKSDKESYKQAMAEKTYALGKLNAETDINNAKSEMLKRPCPINNGCLCFDGCIHFSEGCSFFIYDLEIFNDGYWFKQYPKCKLWSK